MNTPLTREQIETSIAVCDPHFHMWDVGERPNPNLGDASEQLPTYQAADYFSDMSQLPSPLHLVSGVHVETVVGQQEGSETPDTVEETKWVCAQLKEAAPKRPFGVVAYVHLARAPAASEAILQQHIQASGGRLRGVRMILNHHPDNPELTWPKVEAVTFGVRIFEGVWPYSKGTICLSTFPAIHIRLKMP